MIDEAAGYRDGRIGWILSAVELKRGTQEMETAVSRTIHLPLSHCVDCIYFCVFCYVRHTIQNLKQPY